MKSSSPIQDRYRQIPGEVSNSSFWELSDIELDSKAIDSVRYLVEV